MGLSTNAARTLEQVKCGLNILYGAEYFTEEEWIKVDGLIHKGSYVWTRGPQPNILDEELMTFDDYPDTIFPSTDQKKTVVVTERQIPTPISEEPSHNPPESSPHEISVEAFADEAQPTESPKERSTPAPLPPNGGLALGYTQAQLDEVKAFNANLTRAGQKTKPKYTNTPSVENVFPSPEWSQNGENDSPTSAEQESRIHSWASEVNADDPVPVVTIPLGPSNPHANNAVDNIPKVIEKFIQVHGRIPRSTNDVYQPRNPTYKGPKRPDSRASIRTTKSVAPPKGPRKLHATSGTVFIAHASSPKKSNITIEVKAGDSIKYLKHVSGIMHTGLNLRTQQQGQFPETVLEPVHSQTSLIQQQRSVIQSVHGRERVASTISNGLDRVEAMNAAEWDRESISSRPTTATTATLAPVPIRSNAGLAGSRFAALAEMHVNTQASESSRQNVTQAEIRRIIREELAGPATLNANQIRRSQTVAPQETSLTNVIPKSTTCWHWKTRKDCRFTAEECINLHADLPDTGESINPRTGKPTWGALADALPPSPATTTAAEPTLQNRAIDYKNFSKTKTCYYWATDGKCINTAVDCKYLHEYTEAGVAFKPGGHAPRKRDFNWSKVVRNGAIARDDDGEDPSSPSNENGWGTVNGADEVVTPTAWGLPDETSADLLANPNAAIWNAVEGSSAWDVGGDRYKPPHIKALEERERIEAVGW